MSGMRFELFMLIRSSSSDFTFNLYNQCWVVFVFKFSVWLVVLWKNFQTVFPKFVIRKIKKSFEVHEFKQKY